jgi:hypothetical protein
MTIPRDLRLRPSVLLFLFLMNRHTLAAQLWDIPPLASVEVERAADGLTANIGNAHLHIISLWCFCSSFSRNIGAMRAHLS